MQDEGSLSISSPVLSKTAVYRWDWQIASSEIMQEEVQHLYSSNKLVSTTLFGKLHLQRSCKRRALSVNPPLYSLKPLSTGVSDKLHLWRSCKSALSASPSMYSPALLSTGGFDKLRPWRSCKRALSAPPSMNSSKLLSSGPVFVDVYGHLGIDSKNRFIMKYWFWRGHGTWAPRFQLIS